GRLLGIGEPHLVERYNKALVAFGLKPTQLTSFDIDRTGFSPQVAEELGDYQYLDPNEVNRRFIILTPDQIDLPVVHTAFSNTGQLVYEFFSKNSRAIDALTIKDVIYGEIEDSVAKVEDIEDLLSINQVQFRVLSAEDVLGKATELGTLTDRLKREPDAWRDGRHSRASSAARPPRVLRSRRPGGPFHHHTPGPDTFAPPPGAPGPPRYVAAATRQRRTYPCSGRGCSLTPRPTTHSAAATSE